MRENGDAQQRKILHTCSLIFSKHCGKISTPGNPRSGHKVRLSDPTFEKVWASTKATAPFLNADKI